MNPKPDHRIAEPSASAGYAAALERPAEGCVDLDVAMPLGSEAKAALEESLEDWEGLDQEADESNLPRPALVAKKAAWKFLHAVVREVPRYYAVSMWDEGTVVVHTQDAKERRIDVLFDAKGGAECFLTSPEGGDDIECYYAQAEQIDNEQVFAILRKMEK